MAKRARDFMYILAVLIGASPVLAQELEPRRWNHLPIDTNFAGVAYANTAADIDFNPVQGIEDATATKRTGVLAYTGTFQAFGTTARIGVSQGWQSAKWEGILDGVLAERSVEGLTDTVVRLSANLVGAPPLKGEAFAKYRKAQDVETLVGVGLVMRLPTGQYDRTKRLNIGGNRFVFEPQIGVLHNRGPWSFEATTAIAFFTANDSFFNGNRLEQDPIFSIEAHGTYVFRNNAWISAGIGYASGGETTVNGTRNDDNREQSGWTIVAGYPIAKRLSLRVGVRSITSHSRVGQDTLTGSFGLSTRW